MTLADFNIRWGVRARESGAGRGGREGFFKRFRSHIIFKYTPAVRSNICRGLLYAWC